MKIANDESTEQSFINLNDATVIQEKYSQLRITYDECRKSFDRRIMVMSLIRAIFKTAIFVGMIFVLYTLIPPETYMDVLNKQSWLESFLENRNQWLFLGVIILLWFSYSPEKTLQKGLSQYWDDSFIPFASIQLEITGLLHDLLGGKWSVVYSNKINIFEENVPTIPASAFGNIGNGKFLLGGTFSHLKEYIQPHAKLAQVHLYDSEKQRLMSVASKSIVLTKAGGEKESIEVDDHLKDEQPLYDDVIAKQKNDKIKRWRYVQKYTNLPENVFDFMVDHETKIILLPLGTALAWIYFFES